MFIITLTKEEPDGTKKLPNHIRIAPTVAQGGEENKNHAHDKNEEEGEEKY